MNLFRLIHLIITNNARAAVRMGRDMLTHSYRLLMLSILVPAILLVVGLVIEALTGWKGLVIVSGLLNVLALMLFTFWADILAHIVVLKSNLAHAVWEKVPDLERENAQKFIRWLRGITLWISLAWFYLMVLPVKGHLVEFMMAMTAALLLASIASVRQWNGKVFWMAYAMLAVGTFAFSTVSIVSPETAERIKSASAHYMAKARTLGERREKFEAIAAESETAARLDDQVLLLRLLDERNEIRRRAQTDPKCGGFFCTEADARRFMEIEKQVEGLKRGKILVRGEALDQGPDDDGLSEATRAPPDIGRVRTKTKDKVSPPQEEAGSEDEVYSELRKYGL